MYLVNNVHQILLAMLAICFLAVAPWALAADEPRYSLEDAIAMVKLRTDGKVVKARTQRNNGRAVHHIRVVTDDGHVRTFKVDARKGLK